MSARAHAPGDRVRVRADAVVASFLHGATGTVRERTQLATSHHPVVVVDFDGPQHGGMLGSVLHHVGFADTDLDPL